MLTHSFNSIHLCFFLLLLVCGWSRTTCAPGEGWKIWQQQKPDHILQDQLFLHDNFPTDFLWATGTSAFQTEGAWEQDGKGISIWDNFTHSRFGGTADIASDSYLHWEEDVKALTFLGVKAYTFSLSWPRLFPDGSAQNKPNLPAVRHYNRLIDKLLENKIEPIVTLYHWDLPQVLQEQYGGWRNETLIELFEEYASFCFQMFGDKVKYWLTMHNPYLMAVQGYGTGIHAPGETGGDLSALKVAHNMIKAHAGAWHKYNTYFRPHQRGAVSIVLGSHWVEPQTPTEANVELCQKSMEAVLGWFANPIFGDGDYPLSLKSKHGTALPTFTEDEKLWVRNTADFFALSFGPKNLRLGRTLAEYGQSVTPDLRRVLIWIKLQYEDPLVLVAEAGWFSDASETTENTVALYLMKRFVNQVLQAIKFDGVHVIGYTAWSLLDGFEWDYGYDIRRGLFYIDFSEPKRNRRPKTSALYFREIIAQNGFPQDKTSPEIKGHFPCSFHWGIADPTLQVHFHPFSPQFTDPQLYMWNISGDGTLLPVPGVRLQTRPSQCTSYLAIRSHLHLFASTGASHYRFALNWSLILPKGDLSNVNTDVLRYYRCILSELTKMNLKAVVVLYYPSHSAPNWGLPAPLHASGGWLNYSTVEAFRDYASLCYKELGAWVQYWITINEPNRLIDVYNRGTDKHQAAHNLLLSHSKAWRLYEEKYSAQQRGLVSLALHADWAEPANPFLQSNTEAAQRFLVFELARFLDPLLGNKHKKQQDGTDYPNEIKTFLEQTGFQESPLPNFTEIEKNELKGALGFIALNHFTTRLVSPYPSKQPRPAPNYNCRTLTDPTWVTSKQGQAMVPWGLRRVLNWVTQRYGRDLPIIVTASGIDDQAAVDDKFRQYYIKSYLQEALKAHHIDGVNIQGFYVWRLEDRQFPHFGLFTSASHQSKAKVSVSIYKDIITQRGFPESATIEMCQLNEQQEVCSVCVWMHQNKVMLVFAGCVIITVVMLVLLIIFILLTKTNSVRCRRAPKSWKKKIHTVPPRVFISRIHSGRNSRKNVV
ncbi:beta-klotho [Periophthalmus magnuspinnatus]|uniref:beta-klotho n=1 Tax=Periophthalmus magnuspinnatus TaxID=409849 RepID=UPI00145AA3BE|nr:beta-klotho [Periophthalmus magnuspinnatus]